MDSKPQSVSLSTAQSDPSSPKVSLSTSSGIRAPPTIDSDFEYSLSTNGHINSVSSDSSYISDSGFESDDGFVSGEDDFETASERPFVADADDETLEETEFIDEYIISRPLEIDPDEEITELRPLVAEVFEKTSEMPIKEESSNLVEPPGFDSGVLSLLKPVMPIIAPLSGNSDDDVLSSEEEEEEEYGVLGSIRVPGIGVLERVNSAPKVKILDDEEGEEDEDEFAFGVLGSSEERTLVGDFVSTELIEAKGPDDDEEAKFESLEAMQDSIFPEKVQSLKTMEQQEIELNDRVVEERNGVDFGINDTLSVDGMAERDLEIDSEGDIACGIDEECAVNEETSETVRLSLQEMEVDDVKAEKIFNSGAEVPINDGNIENINDGNIENNVFDIGGSDNKKLKGEADVESDLGVQLSDSATSNGVESSDKAIGGQKIQNLDCTQKSEPYANLEANYIGNGPIEDNSTEHGLQSISSIVEPVSVNSSLDPELEVERDAEEDHDLEKSEEEEEEDDKANEGEEIQNLDCTQKAELFPNGETNYVGNGPTEGNAMEHGLQSEPDIVEPVSLNSIFDPELEVEKDAEEDRDLEKSEEEEEVSLSDEEDEDLIFGASDTANQVIDSYDLSESSNGQIVADLDDDEVETDEEQEVKEIFDSAALAALLKAATVGGSDGGNLTFTSADGSRVFSLERPAGVNSPFQSLRSHPRLIPNIFTPEEELSEDEKRKLEKVQVIRVKFLRLIQRLGRSSEDPIAAQVLYRLVLAAGRPSTQFFSLESAKTTAMELESEGESDLDFSLNILIIGKTGVGKSATVNSIFGEEKMEIDAFEPATTSVKEIAGTINGVKVCVLDTPGLKSSFMEQSFNRKILSSIKKFMKKCPPDIVLYVDRVDTQARDLNDLPLLRSITGSLGSSIWRNAIIALTHACSTPPDGPSGLPLGYEVFVAQRSRVIQQLISQAVGDLRMMNPSSMSPVALIENHSNCQKNGNGENVLPNGDSWRPQLLLLCYSMKILSEVNSAAKTQDPFDHPKLFGFRARTPPLPYLLSSLLQSQAHPKLTADLGGESVDSDIEVGDLSYSDHEDEDEYDSLPPFRPLRRSQTAKLNKEQRKAYFDEYDYRVKLLQKKQLREEVKRVREMKKKGKNGGSDYFSQSGEIGDDEEENGSASTIAVPLPDMVLPPSFDGDSPAYRYRFLEPTSQLLTRPVLDTSGWDHDCGYDGVSLEDSLAIANHFPAVISCQITKDKKEFNIHLDSSVAAKHGENGSTMAGFDIQTVGKQLAYILKGETKLKNFKVNKTAAGLAVTFLGENVATGLKIEDLVVVGNRLVLQGSTGLVQSQGDIACGANLEFHIREKDFPIGQDQMTMGLSLMKWRGDLIWGSNFQSQFSVGRSSKVAVRAGLNNKLSGQISVKTSTSDQLQIALLCILPIAKAIFRNIFPQSMENHSEY